MKRLLNRAAVGVVSVLVATLTPTLATAQAAPAPATAAPAAAVVPTCTGTDTTPPKILSATVEDVTPGSKPPRARFDEQELAVHVDNPCGNPDCSEFGPNPDCAAARADIRFTAKRTAGSGAGCLHNRYVDPTDNPQPDGTSIYTDPLFWTTNDFNEEAAGSPQLFNKCAGAYDVTLVVSNNFVTPGIGTYSEPFTQTRSFTVRRPSKLTANATPEPVRVGRTVTVKGHLTRANWDRNNNPFEGYANQRVLLQRRTATGTYNTIKSVRTDRHGYLHTGVKALSGTRCYRWVFNETTTTAARTSGGDCVRAR